MRGRKPKPTHLKLLNGNPGNRPLPENEPKPKVGTTCPTWLSDGAKKEWRRIYPELERLGLVTKVDRASLASYCQAVADLEEAVSAIAEHGTVIVTPSGYMQSSPYVTQKHKAMEMIRKFAAEFGMTPSARARVRGIVPEDPEEAKARAVFGA